MSKELNAKRAAIMLAAEYEKWDDGIYKQVCTNIERRGKLNNFWSKVSYPVWDWEGNDYRVIEPPKEPVYKPYTETKSEWIGKAIIYKKSNAINLILRLHTKLVVLYKNNVSLDEMLINYTWLDGSPCGERVE